jgi:hypothetical protein
MKKAPHWQDVCFDLRPIPLDIWRTRMGKKCLYLFILVAFLALPVAFGGTPNQSLTLIYSNNLFGSIEPTG